MWEREKDNLVICMVISLALHLLAGVFIVLVGGFPAIAELFHPKPPPEPEEAPRLVLLQVKPPTPQRFLETDASQESKERPKNTPFYSDRNTLAQDQSQRTDQNRPEIRGKGRDSIATADVALAKPSPPTPPPSLSVQKTPSPPQPPQPEKSAPNKTDPKPEKPDKPDKATPNPTPDDLAKKQYAILKPNAVQATPAHPDDVPLEAQQAQPPDVPSPEQARAPPQPTARPPVRSLATEASEVTGGISRKGVVALDTQSSPAGTYDKIMFQAIQQRWYYLAGDRYRNQAGIVRIQFEVSSSGDVSNVLIIDNGSVGPVFAGLCRQAVVDSSPFRPFPDHLRALVGDSRRINIYFQYSF